MLQLTGLLAHAKSTCPFYRESLKAYDFGPDSPLTLERLRELPVLTRTDIQEAGDRLNSTKLPKDHGWTSPIETSGSTGRPIRVLTTEWAQTMWDAIAVRDHLWHRRDLLRAHAVIHRAREGASFANNPDGSRLDGWGRAETLICRTGQSFLMDSNFAVDQQLRWLQRVKPAYLITYPSNLEELAKLSLEQGVRLDSLLQARTKGETLKLEQRELVREAWGVDVYDTYSANETGYLALQSPEGNHYLVQSEACLVEVLDDGNEPRKPGELGRVVVTPLHNFATPLIRYEVGDLAEVGPPTPCGRGHGVLNRIMGRVRNMLVRPDGSRAWPYFGGNTLLRVAPVRQIQVVQRSLQEIEARVVCAEPFTPDLQAALVDHIEAHLGGDFNITVHYVDTIERSPSGKFEDFQSEVASSR
ncbi:MAG: phenylacetate--CoA ligase family protein [Alphaproteobacteria bacterium]|nr:phenylacetate--CoA ligase family protein [Alphaproteobacteria bacterium]